MTNTPESPRDLAGQAQEVLTHPTEQFSEGQTAGTAIRNTADEVAQQASDIDAGDVDDLIERQANS
ncbi:hypothetical protein AAEX63_13960 [Luteococcus sp. H138]|uniref:hypothetical protein n=1 Tax=unclassified Luteococcus TaxID=2639923 RepID=UPI00313B8C8F